VKRSRLFLFISCVVIIVVALLGGCDMGRSVFKDNWVLISVQHDGSELLDSAITRNLRITPNEECVIPVIFTKKHYQASGNESNISTFWQEQGIFYVYFDTRSFFRDTFEIQCHGPNCCEITLHNDDKFVRAVYAGELGLTTWQNRRDCPQLEDIIPELKPIPHDPKN